MKLRKLIQKKMKTKKLALKITEERLKIEGL